VYRVIVRAAHIFEAATERCSRRKPAHRKRPGDPGLFAIVQVFSHSRHRQQVAVVITLASVSNRLPWQNGHMAGRVAASAEYDSNIVAVSISNARAVMFLHPSHTLGLPGSPRSRSYSIVRPGQA